MDSSKLPQSVLALIQAALLEDLSEVGDLTSQYFVPADQTSRARIFAKADGVCAGSLVALEVFRQVDPSLKVEVICPEGQAFRYGDTLLSLEGSTRSILTAERTALNFMQRLSAIATMTQTYVAAVHPHSTQILDTRKTTPGWRFLEKAAVKAGGGTNHRMGLYDRVMIKDNHLLAENRLADLQAAIDRLKADHPHVQVELEVDTLEQLEQFLTLRSVDFILLDNMSNETMAQAVALTQGKVFLEASGGVTLERIPSIAATGVNAISIGALTHSVKALDLSLELV